MTDGSLPDRLSQLRSRWEADPASRVFLQLAEEYRHQGRLHEALGVLDEGLKEHPGYLSALVAKGRCLLELGQAEPAREVLERVVRQDATQMVANKLLVRAYLDTGQAARARERLDLYSLLHDGDPEVEDLRARIQRLDGGSPTAPSPSTMAPTMPDMATSPPQDDVFDLGSPPPVARAAHAAAGAQDDVFDLPLPSPPAAASPPPAAAAAPSPPANLRAEAAAVDDHEPEPVAPGEPFPGLVSRAVRRRYLEALAAEGIFHVELPRELERAVAPPPVAEDVVGAEVETVTLGELYLRQGHAGEAERIFHEVLRREPGNAAAHDGLARAQAAPAPAPEVTEVPEAAEVADEVPTAAGGTAAPSRRTKTIQMLNLYLERIRRGSAHHVS
jgi:Tfp pilus assembly protein PilF